MPASLRLLVLLAPLGVAAYLLAVAPPAPPAPPAAADQPVGSFGDARFAAAAPVRHAAFSPDGRWLAGIGRGEVRLWDAASGRLVRRIAFHDSAIGTHVAFTPDGQTVLVLAFEDVPYVPAPPYLGHDWPVTVRRFDAATGAEKGRVRLDGVNAATSQPVAAFTPDRSGVILGGDCQLLARFSTATGRREWAAILPEKNSSYARHLSGVAVSPDGAVVAAVVNNSGGPFHLLNAATGAVLGRLTEPEGGDGSVAFSADGKRIATASRGRTVVVWDAATRVPLARLTTAEMVRSPLALSPTGDRVAVEEFEAGIRVYDVATGRETARFADRLQWPTAAFSPDGTAVATAAGRVIVFDAATGLRRGAVGWSPRETPRFRFSADAARVHVRTGPRGDLVTYELPSGREVARAANTPAAAAALGFSDRERVVSADGRLAAKELGVNDDRPIVVTETATGRERCRVPSNLVKVYRDPVWFSPDGALLITVGSHEVAVWDTTTGRRVRALAEPAPAVGKLHPFLSVAASPGGRYVAVFADTQPRGSSGCGTCDAFSPDNQAKTVTIWDATAWRVVRTVPVPAGSWLLWQTDGRFTVETVARRPADPRARWEPREDEDRPRFDPVPGLGRHAVEEWTVAGGRGRTWRFDPPPRERLVPAPDGRVLAGFDPENPERPGVRLYEAVTGRVVHRLTADEPCRSAAFTPDGRYLLTDHAAAGVRVWGVSRVNGVLRGR